MIRNNFQLGERVIVRYCGSKEDKIGTITRIWDDDLCSVTYDEGCWIQNSLGNYIKGLVVVNFGFLKKTD